MYRLYVSVFCRKAVSVCVQTNVLMYDADAGCSDHVALICNTCKRLFPLHIYIKSTLTVLHKKHI